MIYKFTNNMESKQIICEYLINSICFNESDENNNTNMIEIFL